MKILHTSDWHVGKVLKGRSREDEHTAVLAEIVEIARSERPDLVLVAGDLFDSVAPTPAATRLVTAALSALRGTGAEVVAIAGNHDNGPALDALRPWAEAAGVTLRGAVRGREDHVLTGETAGGERWRLVALPFLSHRYAVRAAEMFALSAAEATQTYADHLARLLALLTESFTPDAVNLVTSHLTVVGATTGGGEREAHTIQSYAVPATVFPASAHYVALGHLHRAQQVPGPAPVRYCGSPLAVDFGDASEPKRMHSGDAGGPKRMHSGDAGGPKRMHSGDAGGPKPMHSGDAGEPVRHRGRGDTPGVTIVEVAADTTAKAREVPVTAAVPLRTIRGTLDELAAVDAADAWLRVYVREQPRAGLREQVQELLPNALEVRIDPDLLPGPGTTAGAAAPAGRSPTALFADYLAARGHADPELEALFAALHDEVVGGGAAPAGPGTGGATGTTGAPGGATGVDPAGEEGSRE